MMQLRIKPTPHNRIVLDSDCCISGYTIVGIESVLTTKINVHIICSSSRKGGVPVKRQTVVGGAGGR